MSRVRAFGEFLYDFVIGEDWRLAVAVVLALAVTAVTSAWWLLPVIVAVVLAVSLGTLTGARRR